MAVTLSASSASRPLPPGRFLVLISVRGWVDPRAIVRLEGSGQLENVMIPSGIEPATFRLVAWILQPTTLPHASVMVNYWDRMLRYNIQRRMVVWLMNWKGFGRKRSWPDRDDIPEFVFLVGLRITTKSLTQDSQCPGRDPNRARPECESRALPLLQPAWCASIN
jgi:hypothetical protein